MTCEEGIAEAWLSAEVFTLGEVCLASSGPDTPAWLSHSRQGGHLTRGKGCLACQPQIREECSDTPKSLLILLSCPTPVILLGDKCYTQERHTIQKSRGQLWGQISPGSNLGSYLILYYIILYYTILYYSTLYYILLYYTMLCYTVLLHTVPCFAIF